ncbi:RpiB/LacA/LacB family sugar-phosphate isomerase [candidate division WWE3 bacterium]|nr:RpiB/LacA/LacB family sugar-phosphate isomerase [candidate division WWE3 bacterium]
MKVFMGADHGGFELKNYLKRELAKKYEIEDLGADVLDQSDDYPQYASKVAKSVQTHSGSLGILICRNGVGVLIAANKYKGIRCALSWNPKHSASARNDDHANIISLPADYISNEEALAVAESFLKTPPNPQERFLRRLKQVEDIKED